MKALGKGMNPGMTCAAESPMLRSREVATPEEPP